MVTLGSASRRLVWVWGLVAVVVGLALISCTIGRYPVSVHDVVAIIAAHGASLAPSWSPATETVVLGIRLPRIAAALLVGAALSSAGAAYQGVFKNPLVSPAILGVSSGAGLGAAVAMLASAPWYAVQLSAFAGGLVAVFTSVTIGRMFRAASVTGLVLALLAGTIVKIKLFGGHQ